MKATHILFPVLAFLAFSIILFGQNHQGSNIENSAEQVHIDLNAPASMTKGDSILLANFLKREKHYFSKTYVVEVIKEIPSLIRKNNKNDEGFKMADDYNDLQQEISEKMNP